MRPKEDKPQVSTRVSRKGGEERQHAPKRRSAKVVAVGTQPIIEYCMPIILLMY